MINKLAYVIYIRLKKNKNIYNYDVYINKTHTKTPIKSFPS